MNYNIYFSHTDTTKKVVQHIGEKFTDNKNIDLSKSNLSNYIMNEDDFCIIGVPSFGGRVPEIATIRLQQLKGNHTPVLLVVTYGGRAYEDTLRELKDTVEKLGFICIGATTLIAEHSIVSQIQTKRPNEKDYKELDAFIEIIKQRLQNIQPITNIPGNYPYKEYKVLPMDVIASEACIKCGLCAQNCPVSAIPLENPKQICMSCISCMRCINICPIKARQVDPVKLETISNKLKTICDPNKQNEFF